MSQAETRFKVNGTWKIVTVAPTTPLLWVLRDVLQLTGTKFGCGIAQCGACTVHVNGAPRRSCVTPIATVNGQSVTTIEGLSDRTLHPVQQAWAELDVVQCGYCQSGQIMAASALLTVIPAPTDKDIDEALCAHICRCGTYQRIRAGVHRAAQIAREAGKETQGDA